MKSKKNKINYFKKLALFSQCTDSEFKIILENSSCADFKKGDVVFKRGDNANCLYIVESGEISIKKSADENKELEIAKFIENDCFGELDMFMGAKRGVSAFADSDAKVISFPGDSLVFSEILEKYPGISAKILHAFIKQISGRIREANALIKQNSPVIQELEKQVYRDKLTGLYNKTFFEENLKSVIEENKGYSPISLIMLKPDNFKAINDEFGHEAGDQTLRIVAKELEEFLKDEATVFRFAGNELAVLYKSTDRDKACANAQKIMSFMHRIYLDEVTNGKKFTLSVSFGIAVYPVHANDSVSLIERAHELPLVGRAMGGNKILFPDDKFDFNKAKS
jgi:diguanylate cyclase (GGDEF)-like protein